MKPIQMMPCKCMQRMNKRSKAALNNLPGQLYTMDANDNIPNICKYPLALIRAAQN